MQIFPCRKTFSSPQYFANLIFAENRFLNCLRADWFSTKENQFVCLANIPFFVALILISSDSWHNFAHITVQFNWGLSNFDYTIRAARPSVFAAN
jgi:hypothetical protein